MVHTGDPSWRITVSPSDAEVRGARVGIAHHGLDLDQEVRLLSVAERAVSTLENDEAGTARSKDGAELAAHAGDTAAGRAVLGPGVGDNAAVAGGLLGAVELGRNG